MSPAGEVTARSTALEVSDGNGPLEPERAADGDGQLADPQLLVHGQFGGLYVHVAGLETDHGDIGGHIGADYLALEPGAVGEPDGHLLGVLHYVRRGEDESALVVDDTRAEPKGRLQLHHGRIEQLSHLGSRLIRRWKRVRHLVRRRGLVRGDRRVGAGDQ